MSNRDAVLKELAKRTSKKRFEFKNYAFPKQLEIFSYSGNRFRTLVTSRRFGKTCGVAGYMIHLCNSKPNINCLYITITRENVRRIIWNDLKRILKDFEIPTVKVDDAHLEVTFPNGSRILTGGAKDANEVHKFLGFKFAAVFIDECQSIRSHVAEELINKAIIPTLRDLRGQLFLIGTPGPVKAGTFYEYTHNSSWAHFRGTAFENPHMHNLDVNLDLMETLREEWSVKGVLETDPTVQREDFGKWVEDSEALVVKYDSAINNFDLAPDSLDYVFGIDIGYNDADALAVLGYKIGGSGELYLIEEVEITKQDITSLAELIKVYQKKYKPVAMEMDAGALGKKIQEELQKRHALTINAADKHRKIEHLEFLNADLRNKKFFARSNGPFAADSKLVTWDRSVKERPKISNSYHSDILDAVLYAYRAAQHYIQFPQRKKIDINSNEFAELQEQRLAEKLRSEKENPEFAEFQEDFEKSEGIVTFSGDDNGWF